MLAIVILVALVFVPFVPTTDPCPANSKCPAFAVNIWGSPAYVLVGVGAYGAFPVMDLHNESGHYVPVTNYFEGFYGFAGCNKGAEWAILYGGPWGCGLMAGSYWQI